MPRKNFPLTLDQLISYAVKAKEKFGGDKYILLSDDEEGNGFHECYFAFSEAKDLLSGGVRYPSDLSPESCIILG